VVQEAAKHPQITGFTGGARRERHFGGGLIDLQRESRETLEAVAATPSAALGSVRKKVSAEDCARLFSVFKKYEIRYFFYIGGNDSAETAHIINDLAGSRTTSCASSTCPRPSTMTCWPMTTARAMAAPPARGPALQATTWTTAPCPASRST